MTCPPLSDLSAANATEVLAEHLAECARCRAIAARIQASAERLEPTQAAAVGARRAGHPPAPGGVWTFWAPTVEEYLVGAILDAGETDVLIVPVLESASWCADADVAFAVDVVGYPALAPVWAGDHLLAEQASEPVGVLSEDRLQRLTDAYDAFLAGEPLPDPAGPPVIGGEDPRIDAQAAIAEDLRPFYTPWALLQVADELGPVLEQRREQLDIDVGEWHDRLDVDLKDWLAFEQAQGDPSATVPVKALARALDDLALLASRRVVELAGASVVEHHVPAVQATAPAKARRRRGVRERPRRDEQAAEAAAESYMASLAKELGL